MDAPVVSFDSLRRARTTLDDFSKFYLPLHGLAQVDFFRWLPQLSTADACRLQLVLVAVEPNCSSHSHARRRLPPARPWNRVPS